MYLYWSNINDEWMTEINLKDLQKEQKHWNVSKPQRRSAVMSVSCIVTYSGTKTKTPSSLME